MTAGAASAGSFDELLGPLLEPAYLLAAAMLGDRSLAEDAVQEASLKAWRKIDSVRDPGALRSWFLSIVANHVPQHAPQSLVVDAAASSSGLGAEGIAGERRGRGAGPYPGARTVGG